MAMLLLGMVAACAGHEAGGGEEIESLRGLALAFPGAAGLIEGAVDVAPRWTEDGVRISVRPEGPRRVGKWSTTARGLDLEVLRDDPRGFVLSVPGVPGRVTVRRVGGEAAASGRVELEATGRSVRVRHGADGVDAFLFATDGGIEELVMSREGLEEIAYEFELPRGWSLRAKGHRPIVEVLNGRGVPEMRMVADRAWDATGVELTPSVRVQGAWVRVEVPAWASTPVLIDPEWQDTGTLTGPHARGTSTLLPDGRVLIAGGRDAAGEPTMLSELFSPITGRFELTDSLSEPRYGHTATLLPTGKVLVAGGLGASSTPIAAAELYDPATGRFEPAGSMSEPRCYHTATALPDGQILLVGGGKTMQSPSVPTSWTVEAELFDPTDETFRQVGALTTPRHDHAAVLLPDGRVLVAGGGTPVDGSVPQPVASCELFDPHTKQFDETAPLHEKRRGAAAVLLGPQGPVLVAGGYAFVAQHGAAIASAELYDISAGTFEILAEHLHQARGFLSANLLPSGKVLFAGGAVNAAPSPAQGLDEAQLFDPATSSFEPAEDMPHATWPAMATLLPSGRVLVVGRAHSAALYGPNLPELVSGDLELNDARTQHAAAMLPTGEVLVVGGLGSGGAIEIFDPTTRMFRQSAAKPGILRHAGPTVTVLPSGQALIVGGFATGAYSTPITEIYDPWTDELRVVGMLSTPRAFHTATLLVDGSVLVTGGAPRWEPSAGHEALYTAERFDPDTEQFVDAGSMNERRHSHTASLLPDGRVMIAGGCDTYDCSSGSGAIWLDSAEIFDPSTGDYQLVARGLSGRASTQSTVLPSGRVLVTSHQSCDVFDRTTGIILPCEHGADWQYGHTATLLPSGNVLIAGGRTWNGPGSTAIVLWDPLLEEPIASAELLMGRGDHTATLLPDGSVAFMGGMDDETNQWRANVEIWREGPATPIDFTPSLDGVPAEVAPGEAVELSGARLTGVSEASGGPVGSATNYPIAIWMPAEGPPTFGALAHWSANSATWTVPPTNHPGPGLLFVATNGIIGSGRPVRISVGALGATCIDAHTCTSGFCVDGLCCETTCDGTCEACTRDKTGLEHSGLCGPVAAGTDPDDECDIAGEACFDGECRVSYCDGHIVHSVGNIEDCSPYRCVDEPATCLRSCSSNADCVAGHYCATGESCQPQRQDQAFGCQPACAVGEGTSGSGAAWLLALLTTGIGVARRRREVRA